MTFKNRKIVLSITLFLMLLSVVGAKISHEDIHDDHHEDEHELAGRHDHDDGKSIGAGKAIKEVDENKGFQLSSEAVKTLSLKLKAVHGSTFRIKKDALVKSKNIKGVYRYRSGFFKFLPAKVVKKLSDGDVIEVKDVAFGDQIVINGVGLLRVTDIYSTDESEYGHSH